MAKSPKTHQLDKSLLIKVSDLPGGDVQLGRVPGSTLPFLFPGGPVCDGRLCLALCDPEQADLDLIEGAPDGTVIGLEVTLKDDDGNVVRSAGVNAGLDPVAGCVSFPKDETEYGLAEIVVTDPLGLASLVVAWVPDC